MDIITTIPDLLTCDGFAQPVTVALMPSDKRLIAAAPAMLEALKKTITPLTIHFENLAFDERDAPKEIIWAILQEARAAIALAKSSREGDAP